MLGRMPEAAQGAARYALAEAGGMKLTRLPSLDSVIDSAFVRGLRRERRSERDRSLRHGKAARASPPGGFEIAVLVRELESDQVVTMAPIGLAARRAVRVDPAARHAVHELSVVALAPVASGGEARR